MTDGRFRDATPCGWHEQEDRSIGTAMRATLGFLAIVLLLLWAGVSDAAWPGAVPVSNVAALTG
jgi:hypothetical protein